MMKVDSVNSYKIPRLVIAAPQGRSGKTTLTLGLCAALAGRGLRVQPYKKGPDYIDPSWLSAAAGCGCRSLDPFFYETETALRSAFIKSGQVADICIVEGNHGLYDGFEETSNNVHGEFESGSTAAVARALRTPVLLVINTARMGRSIAAMVLGYQMFEAETQIAGVVLNNVANQRHEARLREAIERFTKLPVVGALPRKEMLAIPDRHLGLVPSGERDGEAVIEACRRAVEEYIDLDQVLEMARSAEGLNYESLVEGQLTGPMQGRQVSIGVMRDRVFSFYYPENLEALEEAGAELVYIDSLTCTHLPPIQALYIGGGFPEVFMEEVSANASLRREIRQAVMDGMPVYAECGGLMYLSEKIVWGNRSAEMVGAIPATIEMTNTPQGHGYVRAKTTGENPFLPADITVRGHEFHNSRVVEISEEMLEQTGYRLRRGKGVDGRRDGFVVRNTLAGYTHLHVAGAPGWAQGLVAKAREQTKQLFPSFLEKGAPDCRPARANIATETPSN